MASSCSEFNFLFDKKTIYSPNDIPSLISYNKCLTTKIDFLIDKANSLEDDVEESQKSIQSLEKIIAGQEKLLETKLDALSETTFERIEGLKTIQEHDVDNFSTMFSSIENAYSSHLTALSIVLACAGAFFIFGAAIYKKREINEITDDTLEKINTAIQKEGVINSLVEKSLTESKITDLLDSRLKDIANGIEEQILTRVREDLQMQNQTTRTVHSQSRSVLSDIIEG